MTIRPVEPDYVAYVVASIVSDLSCDGCMILCYVMHS